MAGDRVASTPQEQPVDMNHSFGELVDLSQKQVCIDQGKVHLGC